MDIQNQKLTIEGAVTYSRLFDALKGMYEVDDDDSVWEIFNQADDQIEEVVNALKLLSAPPAPVVPDGWEACSPEWIDRNGPCSCANAPRLAFGSVGQHYHPHIFIDNTAQQYESLAGWRMVPIKPTEEMVDALEPGPSWSRGEIKGRYANMLEAAPKPEGQ